MTELTIYTITRDDSADYVKRFTDAMMAEYADRNVKLTDLDGMELCRDGVIFDAATRVSATVLELTGDSVVIDYTGSGSVAMVPDSLRNA